jgi:hypothetical protein
MGLGHSPRIITDGLVLALDAANPKNYNLTAVEVLVVAGGGSGGYGESNVNGGGGGGGGAGGLIYNSNFAVTPGSALTVTVGSGGAVVANSGTTGGNGGNSVFGSLTAIGGGGGGGGDFEGNNAGATGGSGGGAGGDGNYGSTIFSAGTSGQGFAGGARNGTTNRAAAGGGGAGGAGSSATPGANSTGTGGTGGTGLGFNISGTFAYYAGGGGGGASNNFSSGVVNSSGGIGGGGAGGGATGPSNGTANTGGGGGGGYGSNAGTGGSGIVIVRYPGPQKAIGGTVTSSGGFTIHTFTTVESTTFTPLVATNNSAILGLADFSGRNNFGTAENSPTYSSANGGSLVFDGSNEYIDCGNIGNIGNTYTIECFFNSSAVVSYRNVYDMNYTTYSGISGNVGPRFEQFSNNTANWIWSGVTNANDPYNFTTPFSLNSNTWYYTAFTMNNGTVNTYVNGTIQNANISSPNGYVTTFGSVNLGRGFVLAGNRYFSGKISNFKIYNRALTAAEISQNFNALRGRFGI